MKLNQITLLISDIKDQLVYKEKHLFTCNRMTQYQSQIDTLILRYILKILTRKKLVIKNIDLCFKKVIIINNNYQLRFHRDL